MTWKLLAVGVRPWCKKRYGISGQYLLQHSACRDFIVFMLQTLYSIRNPIMLPLQSNIILITSLLRQYIFRFRAKKSVPARDFNTNACSCFCKIWPRNWPRRMQRINAWSCNHRPPSRSESMRIEVPVCCAGCRPLTLLHGESTLGQLWQGNVELPICQPCYCPLKRLEQGIKLI